MPFSLSDFENSILQDDAVQQGKLFYALVDALAADLKTSLPDLFVDLKAETANTNSAAFHVYTVNRLCLAVGQAVLQDNFMVGLPGYDYLVTTQASLSRLFYLSAFGSSDYLLQHLLHKHVNLPISSNDMLKMFLLVGTETTLIAQLDELLIQNPALYAATCLMFVWACSGTAASCANREWAYQRLPDLLPSLAMTDLPQYLLHGYFMFSSYGVASNKHELKAIINQKIQTELRQVTFDPAFNYLPSSEAFTISKVSQKAIEKPVLLVVLEWFNPVHSVYRVLGKSLLACKEKYTLVAVAWPTFVNIEEGFFDALITLSGNTEHHCINELRQLSHTLKPAAIYYPALGMTPWAIYFSNTRLAPVQFASLGHGASSFAREIDYFLVEDDISGAQATHSEKLVRLAPGAMPFFNPAVIQYSHKSSSQQQLNQNINVVCSTSTMKLNAYLLEICARIDKHYAQFVIPKVKFHFFIISQSNEIHIAAYEKLVRSYLPTAIVHKSLDFQNYINELAQMDISVSPFPYSGMNTVIDYAKLGILGIRMAGDQLHEAIEVGMWRRMGLPEWLNAHDAAEYEAGLRRLIDNPEERLQIRERMLQEERWKVFFDGDASQFVDAVDTMIANHTAQLT